MVMDATISKLKCTKLTAPNCSSKPLASSPVDRLAAEDKRAILARGAKNAAVTVNVESSSRKTISTIQINRSRKIKLMRLRAIIKYSGILINTATLLLILAASTALANQDQANNNQHHRWQIHRRHHQPQQQVVPSNQQEQWQQYSRMMIHELAKQQQQQQVSLSQLMQMPSSSQAGEGTLQETQTAYWPTAGATTTANEINDQQPQVYVPYREQQQQQSPIQPKPTTPSINRQLVMPPQYYELGLAPTSAVQIDTNQASEQASESTNNLSINRGRGRSLLSPGEEFSGNQLRHNATARSIEPMQDSADQSQAKDASGGMDQMNGDTSDSTKDLTEKSSGSSEQDLSGSQSAPVDSKQQIEPRQRRRIFNRILKKAEWNHLFVELSKVFLRYFLDLALKDIIGKQGGDATTSRKKLDAQTEITDLLRDVVKNAISNM